MPGGNKNIKPEDGKQFSSVYQPKEKWTKEKADNLGKELIDWLNAKDSNGIDKRNIFFEEFLVIEKDLYPALINYLSHKFSSFLKLIEKAKKTQELKLIKYGVADMLNASMTKFVLTNHHGYKERRDMTSDDKSLANEIDYSKLSTKTLEELAANNNKEEDN